jgi:antitoxin component of RelBE/YafQ-DinJ toxin-antitoxin module
LKLKAEARFLELGMSVDEAITLSYEQAAGQCTEQFSPRIPSAKTMEALRQARAREGLTEYAALEDLKAEFS